MLLKLSCAWVRLWLINIYVIRSTWLLIHQYIKSANIWATTWQNQQNGCAPSEDSDQLGHPPSLIRVFAVRMKKAWVVSYPLSGQRRLWSDWADAQADLSLRWAHTHFVCFVMSRLTSIKIQYWDETRAKSTPKHWSNRNSTDEIDKKAIIRNRYNRIPHPALKGHLQLRRH